MGHGLQTKLGIKKSERQITLRSDFVLAFHTTMPRIPNIMHLSHIQFFKTSIHLSLAQYLLYAQSFQALIE